MRLFVILALLLTACGVPNPLYCDRDTRCGSGQVCNQIARQCAPQRPRCSEDGWCSEVAPAVFLRRAYGFSAEDVWFVGDAGTVVRWNGVALEPVPSGTVQSLFGVWGSAPGDTWIVGAAGEIRRFSASGFSPLSSGVAVVLTGVWGSAPNDVWVVGNAGTILHYDGTAVTVAASPTKADLLALWGSGPRDVWAVGAGGTVLRYDGSAWLAMPSGTVLPVTGVWGNGPGDVWMSLAGVGQVARFTPGVLQVMDTPARQPLYGVFCADRGDVWFAGAAGTLVHYDGAAFQIATTGTPNLLQALWGNGPGGTLLAAGVGAALRYLPLAAAP